MEQAEEEEQPSNHGRAEPPRPGRQWPGSPRPGSPRSELEGGCGGPAAPRSHAGRRRNAGVEAQRRPCRKYTSICVCMCKTWAGGEEILGLSSSQAPLKRALQPGCSKGERRLGREEEEEKERSAHRL